jgi:hypothetical protein
MNSVHEVLKRLRSNVPSYLDSLNRKLAADDYHIRYPHRNRIDARSITNRWGRGSCIVARWS